MSRMRWRPRKRPPPLHVEDEEPSASPSRSLSYAGLISLFLAASLFLVAPQTATNRDSRRQPWGLGVGPLAGPAVDLEAESKGPVYILWTRMCRVARDDPGFGLTGGQRVRVHGVQDAGFRLETRGSWFHALVESEAITCGPERPFQPTAWDEQVVESPDRSLELLLLCWQWKDVHHHENDVVLTHDPRAARGDNDGWFYEFESAARAANRSLFARPVPSAVRLRQVFLWFAPFGDIPVVVSDSLHPDMHDEMLVPLIRLLRRSGIKRGRALFLHYTLPPKSQIDRKGLVSAPSSQHWLSKAKTLPQAWWHGYWWTLANAALRESQRNPTLRSMCLGDAPRAGPSADGRKSLLILGGDPHRVRIELLRRLWKGGLLDDALWSLETPPMCLKQHPPSDPFCDLFPKVLDIKLGRDTEDKDEKFPPLSLYQRTRMSLVFESSISGNEVNTFLTEKVMKPIYGGHPFLLACAPPRALQLLRHWGFETFAPHIDESMDGATMQNTMCRPGFKAIEAALRGALSLGDADRVAVEAAAGRNQRHLVCGGLRKRLEHQAMLILAHLLELRSSLVQTERRGTR